MCEEIENFHTQIDRWKYFNKNIPWSAMLLLAKRSIIGQRKYDLRLGWKTLLDLLVSENNNKDQLRKNQTRLVI